MNETLSLRIIDYLNQKTNYAIIINGKYGIGKTFYLENYLFPEILKIKKDEDKKKEKYKTIKISLFGVATIEDIEKLIFLEAYPILKKKGMQIFGGLLKGAANYISIDLDNMLKDSGLTPGEINNYENFVICFDDIDRKSSSLELSEVYGFINNLVENKSAKVILIANEDILRKEVNKDNEDNYSILREKVIGITFPFIPNIEEIVNSIIEKYEIVDKEYFEFLKSHSSYIINLVKIKDDNLRNVIFFLEHFRKVFKLSLKLISENENLNKIKSEVLFDILRFTLPVAFEYKLGKLNVDNLNLLKDYLSNKRFSLSLLGGKDEDIEKDYVDEFIAAYNDNSFRTINFPSILEYVIGNNILDSNDLLSELKEIYKIESENFTEKELIFSRLRYWQCVDLPLKEYKSETRKLLKLIDEGKITLDEFPIIFHYLTRFENPLNLNIEKLKNKILEKIKNGEYSFVKHLALHMAIDPNESYILQLKEIIGEAIKKNQEISRLEDVRKLEKLFEKFASNFDEFIEDSQNVNNEFLFKPFFASFDFNKLWKVIKKLSNTQLIELGFLIEHRYRREIYSDLLIEKQFLINLKDKLAEKLKSKKHTKLDAATFKNIISKIELVLPNF